MTYSGPERRDSPDIAAALVALTNQVHKLGRLIEGENGSINRGVLGAIKDLVRTDTNLDIRLGKVEKEWARFKWVVVGAAMTGGVAGGVGFDLIRGAVGA